MGSGRMRAVVAAGLAAGLMAGVVAGCSGSESGHGTTPSGTSVPTHAATGAPSAPATPNGPATPTEPARPTKTVKVNSLESDGHTYGVGMPIVLYFSPVPTDSSAFVKAVKVTDNGKPVDGAWYWEQPNADEVARHVIEAHFRPKTSGAPSSPSNYWPADSHVHVDIPIKGLSAGTSGGYDLVYSGKLTSLDYKIGDAHISVVDANAKTMRVMTNGSVVKTFPVSLGEVHKPTLSGTKVVMQKGEDLPGTNKRRPDGTVLMSGPGYTDKPVKWSVRITRDGEYVHDASWNKNIGVSNTSDGCTNLHPADAEWFYNYSRVGDVVTYPNAPGKRMDPGDGLGDWNIPWTTWAQGGKLPHG